MDSDARRTMLDSIWKLPI